MMRQTLPLLLVCWLTCAVETSNVLGTLLGMTIDEDSEYDDTTTESCQLPPYPYHGGYIVLNEKNAKPGDLFVNVSLVQYTADENYRVYVIKRLTCTLGEWYQDILQYQSTTLQFYTSWCPFFCSCLSSDERTECSPPNVKQNAKKTNVQASVKGEESPKQNDTLSTSCRLPPYPSRGSYIVPNYPNAKPGDVFQNVTLTLYTSDESNTVVGIEHFKCSAGTWHQKIFREASEKLQFHTSWCPMLCSSLLDAKGTANFGFDTNKSIIQTDQKKPETNSCILPEYPKFGNYNELSANEPGKPGDVYDLLRLSYTCDTGYTITGKSNVYCLNGIWSDELPKCTKSCLLDRKPGIEYLCDSPKAESSLRPCNDVEPHDSSIYAQCIRPYYKPRSSLKPMKCVNGEWDNIAECKPVCGLRIQIEDQVETDARTKAPWNVAVYSTTSEPYKHICGASIVAANLVISAAECFYQKTGKTKPASEFVVAAGKLYRSFFDPNDDKSQISNVTEISIPPRYFSDLTSYQDDIALVFLSTPFVFNNYVLPVCVNFDATLDQIQLREGRVGQVAGWGRSDRKVSDLLQIVELPMINILQCFKSKSYFYDRFITGDKICAGHRTGAALCNEDSGSGFAVAETDTTDSRKRYYFLRGVVSGHEPNLCKLSYTTFTMISRHKDFITDFFDGLT